MASFRRTATVLLAAAGLAAAPVTTATAAPDLSTGGVHAPVPDLTWTDCSADLGPGIQCATATVPLDYDHPTGPTIDLALARDPADDPAHRIGSLFVNPGGPGGSGVDIVPVMRYLLDPAVMARFDVVGVDPRGVARSAPVRCFASADEQAAFFAGLPPFPVGREIPGWLAKFRAYTARCGRVAGPVIDHVSTANFVRDLDLLRQAVGDPGFTFVGYSYGSHVGSTYAAMFPRRVRSVVIDGVLDPVLWSTGASGDGRLVPFSTRIKSAQGASETLGAFFRTCAAAGPDRCAFAEAGTGAGATASQLARKFDRLTAALRRHPVDLVQEDGSTVTVTYAVFISATLGNLYDPLSFPYEAQLAQALHELTTRPAVPARATAARALAASAPADEPLFDSGFEAVSCADTVNPRSQLAWPVAALLQDQRYKYFGSPWTYASQACATWPGHDTDRYLGPYDKATAHPLLVVGTRYDPATRYQNAQAVAARVPGARLLTLDGYGHTSILSSACVNAYTADYLVTGALPARGTVCRPDRQPFDPAPAAAVAAARALRTEVLGPHR
jgi:pimeloyl-ACP methyl ester carboxylesterase